MEKITNDYKISISMGLLVTVYWLFIGQPQRERERIEQQEQAELARDWWYYKGFIDAGGACKCR